MKIGAQMYTVRNFCKDTASLSETLKRLADIGYKYVQISGTCAYDAEWMKNELDKNGLECVLTHTATQRLEAEPEKVAKEHDILGCKCVGLGVYDFCAGSVEDYISRYKKIAKTLAEHGKYFMHHNHAKEFMHVDGRAVLDILADEFSEDELGFTLDTYWVQVAGGDPAAWIEKLSGRVPCIHLKDCTYEGKYEVIGDGNINFDRVFEKAEKAGTKFMLVEQDEVYGSDPFDCLTRSYKYLHSLGFE